MTTTSWNAITLAGDPILVIGLRPKSTLEGYRVVVDKNVHPALRQVGRNTLKRVAAMLKVPYTPYVEPGEEEYLSLDPASLTVNVDGEGSPASQKQQTAQLLEIIQHADTLPAMGAKDVIERLDDLYFQAICFHASPIVGFVTKTTARQVMKRSAIPLGRNNETDRFKRLEHPELVLESDVHAIMAPSEIAILNRAQFQFMVGDIGLVSQYVPAQVKLIRERFTQRGVPLSAVTSIALEEKAAASVQLAKRLDAFLERIDRIDISRITTGDGFTAQDLKKADFVNASWEIECKPDRVLDLVDALEGRFFDDGFTTEKRRADRFRTRS